MFITLSCKPNLKKISGRSSKNYRRWSKVNCLWYKTLNVRATFWCSACLINESFPKWMAPQKEIKDIKIRTS